jgi:hypothetical protein
MEALHGPIILVRNALGSRSEALPLLRLGDGSSRGYDRSGARSLFKYRRYYLE